MSNNNISYSFLDYRIHYFKEPAGDTFNMEELNPLPEPVIEPNNQGDNSQNIINENNNSNNINSETNNSTNNHRKNLINRNEKFNDLPEIDCFISPGKYDLIIGIAMYAEDNDLIQNTLNGICENLKNLNSEGIPNKRILILIISDGKEKVNGEVYRNFTQNKLLSKEPEIDKRMKDIFSDEAYKNKKPNYLTSCLIKFIKSTPMGEDVDANRSEMDILFSIKKENRGKLDSHYWLFLGFCKKINPKYVILLDTGTVPNGEKALSSLILPMENDEFIAGTCGEMTLNNKSNCTNPTLCAQFLEYKYAHAVDKNFESLFGYISVLPGAFSAYRWKSLNHSKTLEEYFKTIGNDNADCEMANRYLAEDRIFCWALFAMQGKANILRFIPDAQATTDAPELYGEFMLQRRRWINGSNFAMFYVLKKYSDIFSTKHCARQIFFFLLYTYYVIQAMIGYCILGTFYFVYYMICEKNFKKDSATTSLIMSIYLFTIVLTIIISLSIKPIRKDGGFKQKSGFVVMSSLLGAYNVFGFVLAIYTIFNGGFNKPDNINFNSVSEYIQAYKQYWGALALVIISLGNFLFPLMYQPSMICLWLQNFIQYLLFQPTYAIILNVFAVCNIDDVSWGNRDSKAHSKASNYKQYKINYLTVWLIINFIVGWGCTYVVSNPESIAQGRDKTLINAYSILVASLSAFKLLGAFSGKIKYYLIDKWWKGLLKGKNRNNLNTRNSRNSVVAENQNNGNPFNTHQAGLIQDANIELRNFSNNNLPEINEENNANIHQNDIEIGIFPEGNDVVNPRINNNIMNAERNRNIIRENNNPNGEEECKNLNNDNWDKEVDEGEAINEEKGNLSNNQSRIGRVYKNEGEQNPNNKLSFPS